MFKTGDIIGLGARWWEKWLPPLLRPRTDVVHHLMVLQPLPQFRDCLIGESKIGLGVRMGRLSWYTGHFIRLMRVPGQEIASLATYEASGYSRRRYDYLTILWLGGQMLCYWLTHGFRPLPYTYLRDLRHRGILCTALITQSYEKYYPLIPSGVASTPAAMEQARREGRLATIFEGILTPEVLCGRQ